MTDPRPPIKTIDDVVVSAGPIGVAIDEQTIANAQRKSSRKAEPSLTMYTKDKAAFVQVSDRRSDQLDDDSRDRIEMMVGFANPKCDCRDGLSRLGRLVKKRATS